MSKKISNNDFIQEKIISNSISLNPTGILILNSDGTFKMNGPSATIMTPTQVSQQNLNSSNNNTFICNQNESTIEKFENYNVEKKSNKNIIIYFVIILFLSLLIFFFIYKKRKI